MERRVNTKQLFDRLRCWSVKLGRYKYAVLILLLGVGLMLLPETSTEPAAEETELQQEGEDLEKKLETILRQVEHAGDVRVMLTLSEGISYEYQTNDETITDEDGMQIQKQTVLVTDVDGRETPVTVRTRYPVYQGAVILCEGADSAAVRLNIVNAVSDLTGLGSDKISVIKMKDQ